MRRIDMLAPRLITLAFTKDDFWSIITANRDKFPKEYQVILNDPKSEAARFFEMQAGLYSSLPDGKLQEEFDGLLRELEIESLRERQDALKLEMRQAEEKGEDAIARKFLEEFNTSAKRINDLKTKR